MSDLSPRLGLPYILASQAQKHVTHNEALLKLDSLVQLSVASKDLTSPPGAPANGDAYIIPAGATGAWAGQVGKLAVWQENAWAFHDPTEGWTAWVSDLDRMWSFDGTAWVQTTPAEDFQNIPMLGVNTTADTTNRLSVSSPATLLNNEGAGHQLKINKNAAADTASLLFQTAWTGYAEMGLAGDNDFSIKTSDGTSWFSALKCNSADGRVSFPSGVSGAIPVYDTGFSTFIGEGAGTNDDLSNNYNTFIGYFAGNATTTGSFNIAYGSGTLRFNTTGSGNAAVGTSALQDNTTGNSNTANGTNALRSNTTGNANVAVGPTSLFKNTTGSNNVASGANALNANTTGSNNAASGAYALYLNTTGSRNVANGMDAGRYITSGAGNVTSANSTYIGFDTRASADGNTNETVIGYAARGNGSNTVTLGNSSITGLFSQVALTVVSDRRDKVHVGDVPHGLDFINKLRPAAFQYTDKRGGEASGPVRYGFYAQDVMALEDTPVIVDAKDPEKLKMNETALIAVLANAVQELTAQVSALSARTAKLEGE